MNLKIDRCFSGRAAGFLAGAATLITLTQSCAKEAHEEETKKKPVGREQAVRIAARENKIPENVMLAAAYSQSQFGLAESGGTLNLKGDKRSPIFNMEDSEPSDDVYTASQRLAKSIKEAAQQNGGGTPSAEQAFEWIYLTANTIVNKRVPKTEGEKPDPYDTPDARKVARAMIMNELIHTYNNGYLATVDKKLTTLSPADPAKMIIFEKLDPGQQGRLSSRVATTANLANTAAEVERPLTNQPVKVVLRWCPGSAYQCFEWMRQSADTSAHYLIYRGLRNEQTALILHNPSKDLKWYNKTATNTITFMLTGLAGTNAETLNPQWYDWTDYTTLWMWVAGAFEESPSNEFISQHTYFALPNANLPDELKSEGQFAFDLPVAFDAPLFREILDTGYPASISEIDIKSPARGEVIKGKKVNLKFVLQEGTETVEVFRDENPVFDKNGGRIVKPSGFMPQLWDSRLGKEDVEGLIFEDSKTYTEQGATRDSIVSLKVVCRGGKKDINGNKKLLSSKIVRFVMPVLRAEQ